MILDATTKSLEIVLGAAHTTSALQWTISYASFTASAYAGGASTGLTNGTSVVTLLAAPAASAYKQVRNVTVVNTDTVNQTVTIQYNDNSNIRKITSHLLAPGEALEWCQDKGWQRQYSLPVIGQAVTKTDDTNVTLTLGGTPSQAAVYPVSFTLGWTGTLSVARGGTGAATLTGYLKGNGTGAITASASIPAADISFTPTGGISSTNVQGALAEVDSEKLALTGGAITGDLTVAGTLGVGVAAPFGKLSVAESSVPSSATAVRALRLGEDSNNSAYYLVAGLFQNSGLWRGSIDAVAAGGPTPLCINPSLGSVRFGSEIDLGFSEHFSFYNPNASHGMALAQNDTADKSGILIQHARASGATSADMMLFYNAAGTEVGSISSNGSVTTFNTTSDSRLKENIKNAEGARGILDRLAVRQFDWRGQGAGHQRFGFIAQELVEHYPEAVLVPENPDDMMAVDYSKLVPLLLKGWQEQAEEIAALSARIEELEALKAKD